MAVAKWIIAMIAVVVVAVVAVAAYAVLVLPSSSSSSSPSVTPAVLSTSPDNSSTGVPINAKILVTFNEAMEASTINTTTFKVMGPTTAVTGTVTYTGTTALFTPSADLTVSLLFTATITTATKDASGQALAANYVWSFTTGTTANSTAPTVSSTFPSAAGTGVPVDDPVGATFTAAMNPFTITTSTFTLKQGSTSVGGTVSYSGFTATFTPSSNLATSTKYNASITTGAMDVYGNALTAVYTWNFTTSAASGSCAQSTVQLYSAARFAIVAYSTVTNTGNTQIKGDIGVSPGSSITGFPPGKVTGTIYTAVPTAAAAAANVTIAYLDASGRTLCPVSVAGNLGGLTLAPGLYKSTSGLEVTGSDLTLDAHGDSSAVFIFQIASTLKSTAGLGVILTGNAQASNVFWQVGSSATLGTNSSFVGTILAHDLISLANGATLDGRAFSETAEVTLEANTITDPSA